MASKNLIKQVRFLHQKKYRSEEGLFLAEGDKIVGELLATTSTRYTICHIFALNDWLKRNERLLLKLPAAVLIHEVSDKELEVLSTLHTPNQVVAVVTIPESEHLQPIQVPAVAGNYALAIDFLQDPGNMGTILRIADWFGINTVFCSHDCVEVYNPKVVQATMGALWRVQTHYVSLPDLLQQQPQNLPIYGALLNGYSVHQTAFGSEGIVIIGSEAAGIRPNVLPYIRFPISIPRHGQAESLNAAVATGIICALIKR